jgi:hypothetical protein
MPEEEDTSEPVNTFATELTRSHKCDVRKPSCSNCDKSGRQCEGYARFPIFLNRTMDGTAPRVHLEESKPSKSRNKHDSETLLNPGLTIALSLMGISQCQAWKAQVVAWFWESYATVSRFDDGDRDVPERNSLWLYRAVEVPHPLPVLKQALLALSIVRYGRVTGNVDLTSYGQRLYGIVLRALQQAMYDENSATSDATLASVRVLVLYEVSKKGLRSISWLAVAHRWT